MFKKILSYYKWMFTSSLFWGLVAFFWIFQLVVRNSLFHPLELLIRVFIGTVMFFTFLLAVIFIMVNLAKVFDRWAEKK